MQTVMSNSQLSSQEIDSPDEVDANKMLNNNITVPIFDVMKSFVNRMDDSSKVL